MVLRSGSYANRWLSGSENFPNSTDAGGLVGSLATSSLTQSTVHQGTYQFPTISGSENYQINDTNVSSWKIAQISAPILTQSTSHQGVFYNYRTLEQPNLVGGDEILGTFPNVGNRTGSFFGPLIACKAVNNGTDPSITNRSPGSGGIQVPVDADLQFTIDDSDTESCFGGTVDINTVHVALIVTGVLEQVVLSGAFVAPYNGPDSAFIPGGTKVNGIFNGFDVVIDNANEFDEETTIIISITGSDVYGNTIFDEYPFLTEGGCPLFSSQSFDQLFDDGDYTIVLPAKSLIEHQTGQGCDIQQAPRQFGVPGSIRLRTSGVSAYTNIISNRSFNQENKTDFPLGSASV